MKKWPGNFERTAEGTQYDLCPCDNRDGSALV
ncbi:protein of unknown function [Ralstonia solanacearum CFBP2957]|nr:protein of unknown function [Ralstonia solanacearum CFBP2957]